MAEENATRSPAFRRMEDVARPPTHDRHQQTDVVYQIRPSLQRRRDVRQRPETDDGERAAFERAF